GAAQPGRQGVAGLGEILLEVPADVVGRVQVGQGVDEAEELDLDRLVTHGPLHELVVEPGGAEDNRAAAVEAGEQVAAVGAGALLAVRWGGGHGGPRGVNGAGRVRGLILWGGPRRE